MLPIAASRIRLFWSVSMPLSVRALWFRLLCRKLPTATALSTFERAPSDRCRLCYVQADSFLHFVVHCPFKWSIWIEILACFYPFIYFKPIQVYKTLCLEARHPLVPIDQELIQILSVTQWRIWSTYWNTIIHSSPFDRERIVDDIISHFSISFRSHTLLT